jgi:predicted transposase YbfD/YdcC
MIAVCAILCGAESFVDFERFGKAKLEWFSTFLKLPNGIPSHDTFGRIFAMIDPRQFSECFTRWTLGVRQQIDAEIVAIDGKTLRRSHDRGKGVAAIHMVSAWGRENGLVLGQRKVDSKSNEITAIPHLVRALDLKGCVVTLDAMGCQKEIAKEIIAAEADYVLAVKGNQSGMRSPISFLASLTTFTKPVKRDTVARKHAPTGSLKTSPG